MSTVARLFVPEPPSWGLRGDVYLWQEMRTYCEDVAMPTDPDELEQLLEDAFERLTGCTAHGDDSIYVERFSHGGMSSGMVHPPWWQETGFPLLLGRQGKV